MFGAKRTALVTGSAGFIGRHLTAGLMEAGYHVRKIDVKEGFTFPFGQNALNLFAEDQTRYDLVAHCAAVSPHRAGIDTDKMSFVQNVQLDSAMFDWAVRTNQRRVLYFSSSAVYPAYLQSESYTGDCMGSDMMRLSEFQSDFGDANPHDNYGWAKLTGEKMADAAREAGIPVTVVRPFSGYGEDQSLSFPFPSIVARAKAGDLSVWGPPGQTRDWVHVEDVVGAALAIVDSETTLPVNICTGRGVEMGELARMIWAEHLNNPAAMKSKVEYQPEKPYGVFYRVGDPQRMLNYYTPKVSLEWGIRRALCSK